LDFCKKQIQRCSLCFIVLSRKRFCMNITKIPLGRVVLNKMEESVLVVKRSVLEKHDLVNHQGIKNVALASVEKSIVNDYEYLKRGIAEDSVSYKQIIPYIVFKHQESYFLMQRSSKASEKRLANNYSLGIGGHLRKEDIDFKRIHEWGMREFKEEVAYCGTGKMQFLGVLNDDSTEVGKVHLGLVFIYEAASSDIRVRSELKSGVLATKTDIIGLFDMLESWSQMVITALDNLEK